MTGPIHSATRRPVATSQGPALRPATVRDQARIDAAVKALQADPAAAKRALAVDAKGLRMFQQGSTVYVNDTKRGRWFVSEGHAAPKAANVVVPQRAAQAWKPATPRRHDDLSHRLAGAMGGLQAESQRNAAGIAVSGGLMNLGMGAAFLLGGFR